MRIHSVLAATAMLVASLAARADTFQTFIASGLFNSGSSLSGSIVLDETSGQFSQVDFVVSSPDSLDFTVVQGQACGFPVSGDCELQLGTMASGLPNLNLAFYGNSLVGFAGGPIASESNPANGFGSGIYYSSSQGDGLENVTLTPTPEPSSIALLGTGLLGVASVVRKRFA